MIWAYLAFQQDVFGKKKFCKQYRNKMADLVRLYIIITSMYWADKHQTMPSRLTEFVCSGRSALCNRQISPTPKNARLTWFVCPSVSMVTNGHATVVKKTRIV